VLGKEQVKVESIQEHIFASLSPPPQPVWEEDIPSPKARRKVSRAHGKRERERPETKSGKARGKAREAGGGDQCDERVANAA